MRLIPVLDLKEGVVVRGVGGRREAYRPVESVVAQTAEPVEVATSLRERFGLSEFYIADLDAIAGGAGHADVVRELAQQDFELLVDAGLRDVAAGRALIELGATRVIAALETSPGPEHLQSLVAALGVERVTFSVDLKGGALLTAGEGWASVGRAVPTSAAGGADMTGAAHPARTLGVVTRVVECGVRSLILLDLAGVGEGRGVPTLELCRAVRGLAPDVEIITGGGVRNATDLEGLEQAGVDGVLVASALHNGALTAAACARWRGSPGRS